VIKEKTFEMRYSTAYVIDKYDGKQKYRALRNRGKICERQRKR